MNLWTDISGCLYLISHGYLLLLFLFLSHFISTTICLVKLCLYVIQQNYYLKRIRGLRRTAFWTRTLVWFSPSVLVDANPKLSNLSMYWFIAVLQPRKSIVAGSSSCWHVTSELARRSFFSACRQVDVLPVVGRQVLALNDLLRR